MVVLSPKKRKSNRQLLFFPFISRNLKFRNQLGCIRVGFETFNLNLKLGEVIFYYFILYLVASDIDSKFL